jgi:hypothetical protein
MQAGARSSLSHRRLPTQSQPAVETGYHKGRSSSVRLPTLRPFDAVPPGDHRPWLASRGLHVQDCETIAFGGRGLGSIKVPRPCSDNRSATKRFVCATCGSTNFYFSRARRRNPMRHRVGRPKFRRFADGTVAELPTSLRTCLSKVRVFESGCCVKRHRNASVVRTNIS